jgi:hypothetical protein
MLGRCFSSTVVGVGCTSRAGLVRGVLRLVVLWLLLWLVVVVSELGLELVELLCELGEERHVCGIG